MKASFSRSPRGRYPYVELLEQRIVLASNLWIGPASGDWNTASNWSDGVPTADDDVTISPLGALTVTVSAGAQVAHSVTMASGLLQITGGSLALSELSSVANLSMSGGSLSLVGGLMVSSTVEISGNADISGGGIYGFAGLTIITIADSGGVSPIASPVPLNSVSTVPPLAAAASIALSWGEIDNIGVSGIGSYDVFVSDNGGSFTPFLLGTTDTSATFQGSAFHTYSFSSSAIGNAGNLEPTPITANTFADIVVGHHFTGKQSFTDGDGDTYTVSLTGPGSCEFVQGGDGGISSLTVLDSTAKSAVSISVKASDGGDGKVSLDQFVASGALGSLLAPSVTLHDAGISISGSLGKLSLGDVFDGADIHLGGTATNKTSLKLGVVADGTDIATSASITSLTAKTLGEGSIHAPALGKLVTTAGGIASDLTIAGAIGSVSVKGGGVEGVWTASKFGALKVTGGDFAADTTAIEDALTLGKTAAIKSISVSGGNLTGDVHVHGNIGAVSVKASKIGVGGSVVGSHFELDFGTLKSFQARSIAKFHLDAGSAGKLSTTNGGLDADISLAGAISRISTKGGGAIGDWDASRLGVISINGGPFNANLESTLNIAKVTVIGGAASGHWDANGFGSIAISGGALSADITAFDKIASITIKGGGFSGTGEAGSFGKVSITGGDFSGTLYAEMLSTKTTIAGVTITGGNLTGTIGSASNLGAVAVKADKFGMGGQVTGANIFAASIASFITSGDVTDSLLLSGANLGSDFALGGVDTAADSFARGSIGKVRIGGDAHAAVIAAGLTPTDGSLRDANDAIIGGTTSAIGTLTVTGAADAETYFAAGLFKGKVKIAGSMVTPATDSRFLT